MQVSQIYCKYKCFSNVPWITFVLWSDKEFLIYVYKFFARHTGNKNCSKFVLRFNELEAQLMNFRSKKKSPVPIPNISHHAIYDSLPLRMYMYNFYTCTWQSLEIPTFLHFNTVFLYVCLFLVVFNTTFNNISVTVYRDVSFIGLFFFIYRKPLT